MDEVYSDYEGFHGSSNAHALTTGFTFKLQRHPRADQNAEYLVTSTQIQAHNGSIDAAGGGTGQQTPGLHVNFTALLASQLWYSACSITITWPTIWECLVPQYSAQKRWKVPSLVAVK